MRPHLFLLPHLLKEQLPPGKNVFPWQLASVDKVPRPYLLGNEIDDINDGDYLASGAITFKDLEIEIGLLFAQFHHLMLLVTLAGYDIIAVHFHNRAVGTGTESFTLDLTTMSFRGGNVLGTPNMPEDNPWTRIGTSNTDCEGYQTAIIFETKPRHVFEVANPFQPLSIFEAASDDFSDLLDGGKFRFGENGFGFVTQNLPSDYYLKVPLIYARAGGHFGLYKYAFEADGVGVVFVDNVSSVVNTAWEDLVGLETAYTENTPSIAQRERRNDPINSSEHGLLPMFLPRGWVMTTPSYLDENLIRSIGKYTYEALKSPISIDNFLGSANTFKTMDVVEAGVAVWNVEQDDTAVEPSLSSYVSAIEGCMKSAYSSYDNVSVEMDRSVQNKLPETIDNIVLNHTYVESILMLQEMGAVRFLRLPIMDAMLPEWTNPDITGFYDEIPLEGVNWTGDYGESSPDVTQANAAFPMKTVDTLQINQAGSTAEAWLQEKDDSTTPHGYACFRLYVTDIQQLDDGNVLATAYQYEPSLNFSETPPTGADYASVPDLYVGRYVILAHATTFGDDTIGHSDFMTALSLEGNAYLEKQQKKYVNVVSFLDADEFDNGSSREVKRFVGMSSAPFLSPRHFMGYTGDNINALDGIFGTSSYEDQIYDRQIRPFHSIEKANIAICIYRLLENVKSFKSGNMTPQAVEAAFKADLAWLGEPDTSYDNHMFFASALGQSIYANHVNGVEQFSDLVDVVRAGERGDCQGIQNFFGIGDVHLNLTALRFYNWREEKYMTSGQVGFGGELGINHLFIEKERHPAEDDWSKEASYWGAFTGASAGPSFGFSFYEESESSRMWTEQNWSPSDFSGPVKHVYASVDMSLYPVAIFFGTASTDDWNYAVGRSTFISTARKKRHETDDTVEYEALSLSLPTVIDFANYGVSGATSHKKLSITVGAGVEGLVGLIIYTGGGAPYYDAEALAWYQKLAITAVVDVPLSVSNMVYFDIDKYDLTEYAQYHLRELAAMYRNEFESPGSSLIVTGYCDRTGTHDYNYYLSKRRAETVVQFLYSILGEALRIRLKYIKTNGNGEVLAQDDGLADETSAKDYRRVTIELNGRSITEVNVR